MAFDVFRMNRSSKDEKLFHNLPYTNVNENIFTMGRGSYTDKFEISLVFGEKQHVLCGRFCSLATEIVFLINGNHSIKSVTTSPIDVGGVVKDIFGGVRPNIRPIPNIRKNHLQVIIGNDVWIGFGATIMGGVKIGNGAIIGSRSVVTKDIPPYAIAVGNPARVVKYRFDEGTIRKLLAIKWWNWSLEKIADNFPLMNDVEKFLETHYTPELEVKANKISTTDLKISNSGGDFYHFIPDFLAKNPLWSKVVREFRQAKLANALLIIWIGKDTTTENINSLIKEVDFDENILLFKHEENRAALDKNMHFVPFKDSENFSPLFLRHGTHFITTREMETLEALDYLWDTDVKIISALDKKIFSM